MARTIRFREARRSASGFSEAVDAVLAHVPRGVPFRFEVVEVREGLPDGEAELMRVQLAAEEHGHEIRGGARLGDGVCRLGEPLVMVLSEVVEPVMETAERQPM